jgi:thioredoxin reductase
MDAEWDCVVVGGGAAGLSAALVLGRARRRTLVIDAGRQSNLPAHGIGGLLGHDGKPPAELYEAGRRELARYPSVELRSGEVLSAEPGFVIALDDGSRVRARTVLLATGMDYSATDLPGLHEMWGRSVFHCPFCHGWELRERPLAVLARGDRAVHSALLLRGWTDDVVVLSDGPAELSSDDRARLAAAGVRVDERRLARLVAEDQHLAAVEFVDGTRLARAGALVAARLHQRSDLAAQLGVTLAATRVSADSVVIDELHRTSVPGVFAAGDAGAALPQVAAAVAAGSMAAASIVQTLLADDVGLPVPEWPTTKEQDDVRV